MRRSGEVLEITRLEVTAERYERSLDWKERELGSHGMEGEGVPVEQKNNH